MTLCTKCHIWPAQEPHTCPYQRDVHDNDEECECCSACEGDCSDAI